MSTPAFIEWLDRKMAEHGNGKLIPPHEVIAAELDEHLKDKVRSDVRDRILREAGYETQVAEALAAIERPSSALLTAGIKDLFEVSPEHEWREHVERVATKLAEKKP